MPKKKKRQQHLVLEEQGTPSDYIRVVLTPKGKIFKETFKDLGPLDISLGDGTSVPFTSVTLSSKERLA